MTGRREREVDVLVVGAGPAGLTAAAVLSGAGAGRVEVLEREADAGGIPRHSFHPGYGLLDLRRPMDGPSYARRLAETAVSAGADVRTRTTVTGWAGPRALDVTCADGLERVTARAVVLATGARERPRSARWVPGDRPAGVYTTGQLQQAVYLKQQEIGTRAVVVGAEHVSFSAAVTLAHAGVRVVAMVTEWARPQTYQAFRLGARLRYGFPVLTSTRVAALRGRGRVEAVELQHDDGRTASVRCDTVVFTGDWIPDHELAVTGGIDVDLGTKGPVVDGGLRTSVPGIFAAGNLLHPVTTADVAALDGRHVADGVVAHLGGAPWPGEGVPLVAAGSLRWLAPQRLVVGARPPRHGLVAWGDAFVAVPTVHVEQDARVLHHGRWRHPLVPQRPFALPRDWWDDVLPTGGEVVVTVR